MKKCLHCNSEFTGPIKKIYCSLKCSKIYFWSKDYKKKEFVCREDLEGEVWKIIENTNDRYSISNTGLVRTNYKCDRFTNWQMIENYNNLMILTPNRGYLSAAIYLEDNTKKTCKVHRLVATYFIDNPKGLLYVNHKDFNRANNNVENLEWITCRDNVNHSFTRQNKSSKYVGACWDKHNGKWVSKITISGKSHHLGSFKTELEAHEAYMKRYLIVNAL